MLACDHFGERIPNTQRLRDKHLKDKPDRRPRKQHVFHTSKAALGIFELLALPLPKQQMAWNLPGRAR
jgi:hypothetical protein